MSHGYAGKILEIDLSSGRTLELATADYAEKLVGGRGFAARLYWERVPPDTAALGEQNALVFATGPLAGVSGFGGSRWLACGKSPATSPERFCYSNLGGDWGVRLKSVGYDALLVRGRLDKPGYLFISGDRAELRDASGLWGRGAIDTGTRLRSELGTEVGVASIGPAGENLVTQATLLAENEAVGSAGLGAVMGSKNLKAIAVKGVRQRIATAEPERVRDLAAYFRSLGKEPVISAGNLVFRITGPQTRKAPCWGCIGTCHRRIYQARDGRLGKFMCEGATFYQAWAEMVYGPGYEVPFRATKLADDYGLDTMAVSMVLLWLRRCHRAGILTDEATGIPISKLGSAEFIEVLLRKMAYREGFGEILAQGIERAARHVGQGSRGLIEGDLSVGGMPNANDPRLYITTALIFAGEPRPPMGSIQELSRVVHKWVEYVEDREGAYVSGDVVRRIARRFWGSESAGDLSSFEGKPLAAAMIQDRQYAKDCLVLCGFLWPVLDVAHSSDHVGGTDLESRILSAVTGREVNPEELLRVGERVFNLERAIHIREGHRGREGDRLPEAWHTQPFRGDVTNLKCLVPGKDGQPVSRKGAVIDRREFAAAQGEYYRIRGWDQTGYQTLPRLAELGLEDVGQELAASGLAARGLAGD